MSALVLEFSSPRNYSDDAVDWRPPSPILRPAQVPEPYPMDALPDSIGEAVREYQRFGQQPHALVACSALAMLAAVCQGHGDVARDPILRGPLSLNFLVIAASGERKTAADRTFGRSLREFESEAREQWKMHAADHEAGQVAHQTKRQKLEADLKAARDPAAIQDLKKALGALIADQQSPPREPRLILADVTPEALASILADGWPSALLLSDEGGMILGSHATQRESASRFLGMLNALWDASAAITLDRRSAPSLRVEGRRLSTCIQIQREALLDFLGRTGELARGSGFLARFLIAWPESTAGTRRYQEPPAILPCLERLHRRISELLTTPMPLDDSGRLAPPLLQFSDTAKAAWVEIHNLFEEAIGAHGEFSDIRDVAAKAAENVARLAGIFAVFNGDNEISDDAIGRAARIVGWHVREAQRVLDALGDPSEIADAQALDAWLLAHCRMNAVQALKAGDILRLGPSRVRKPARRDAALAVLEEAGRIRVETIGRRTLVSVNPGLLVVAP